MPTVEIPYGTFNYDPATNILTCRIRQEQTVDVDEINSMLVTVEKLIGPKRHYAMVDFGSNLQSTTEARKIYADAKYLHAFRLADAFLVKSLAVRLVANFFINVTKPKVRTRLFTDEAKAYAWLENLKKKESSSLIA